MVQHRMALPASCFRGLPVQRYFGCSSGLAECDLHFPGPRQPLWVEYLDLKNCTVLLCTQPGHWLVIYRRRWYCLGPRPGLMCVVGLPYEQVVLTAYVKFSPETVS